MRRHRAALPSASPIHTLRTRKSPPAIGGTAAATERRAGRWASKNFRRAGVHAPGWHAVCLGNGGGEKLVGPPPSRPVRFSTRSLERGRKLLSYDCIIKTTQYRSNP